ncbi:MAG: SEC-C domain-containing protein [Anaerolineales bacterium]|nr:SEC-C domain-containing protein [Anaerolineales bacterium]MCB9434350.1 SEC-C domain-containing protein [Ardenticatenaceae bacterium]
MTQLCPCKSGKPYQACCQPFHDGQKPPTPLALMRSRFAAYALGKVRYIVKTEHPDSVRRQRDGAFHKDLKLFCELTDFVGLQILGESTLADNRATVTFHAMLVQRGKDASFTECSVFERLNGRWLYRGPLEGKSWGQT